MPAIQPARLKKQSLELVAKFNQPALFTRELRALLDMYSDHTQRKGQAGEPSPLISSYKVSPQVMRQVWVDLHPLIQQSPADAFSLCDALWAQPILELKLLAARLLGNIPVSSPEPVINRVDSWISQGLEKSLLDGVLQEAMSGMRMDAQEKSFDHISSWLRSSEFPVQQAGLRALLTMVDDSSIDNLPTVFRLLTPYLRIAPASLRPDILAVLSALTRCSPSETAYLLRQNLQAPDNPDTAWVIRQVLDEFPPDVRSGLRQALKKNRQSVSP